MSDGAITDLIIKHYREQQPILLKAPDLYVSGRGRDRCTHSPPVLFNVANGLGDTLMLTDLPKASKEQGKEFTCFSNSKHFQPLMARNPFWRVPTNDEHVHYINAPFLIRQTDCGNGHYLQRIRRAFGLKVENVPRPFVAFTGERYPNRVVLHFDPGPHALWQRKNVHPHARELAQSSRTALELFIKERKDLDFYQVGNLNLLLKGAKPMPTPDEHSLIDFIGSCSWFIGIMSGPLHLATALQLKCVVIVNFPSATKIFQPCLRVTGLVESEWYYPQHVHLHQEDSGPLVPALSAYALQQAFNGEIYPFLKTDFCFLIHEPL